MHTQVLLELAVLQVLKRQLDPATGAYTPPGGRYKTLYVAPSRALVQEKVRDWGRRFGGTLGLSVQEVTGARGGGPPGGAAALRGRRADTLPGWHPSLPSPLGDTEQEDVESLDCADLICTTPEKFDAMTRRHRNAGGMRFFRWAGSRQAGRGQPHSGMQAGGWEARVHGLGVATTHRAAAPAAPPRYPCPATLRWCWWMRCTC